MPCILLRHKFYIVPKTDVELNCNLTALLSTIPMERFAAEKYDSMRFDARIQPCRMSVRI